MTTFEIPSDIVEKAKERARAWGTPVRVYYDPDGDRWFLAHESKASTVTGKAYWVLTVEPGAGDRFKLTPTSQAAQKQDAEERADVEEQAETIRKRTRESIPDTESERRKPPQGPVAPTIYGSEETSLVFADLLGAALVEDADRLSGYLEPYLVGEGPEQTLSPDFQKGGFLAGFMSAWANSGAPTDMGTFKAMLYDYVTGIRAIQKSRPAKEIAAELGARPKAIYPSRPRGPATISKGQYRGIPSTGGAMAERLHHVFPAPDARLKMPPKMERQLWDLVWQSYRAYLSGDKAERQRRAAKRREFTLTYHPTGTVSAGTKRKRR